MKLVSSRINFRRNCVIFKIVSAKKPGSIFRALLKGFMNQLFKKFPEIFPEGHSRKIARRLHGENFLN